MEQTTESENKFDLTFEGAMARLEEIVRKLESGELPLDESIRQYQESMQLVKFCREQLDKAEFQLEQLSIEHAQADANGSGEVEGA
ncbi:exodeoxyribonuclease VII small subunit [Alicyclobacillus acidiphilus]|uniref:exodeoxyribonuclease VII small subunit n=1 Tax=Alicyclobacillus acidiphilus TaxID=182455 RepID=UPI00082DE2E2|nr:exodeoxyribonuclease VII small subunit [Alicyclobacillus acidiphilus]